MMRVGVVLVALLLTAPAIAQTAVIIRGVNGAEIPNGIARKCAVWHVMKAALPGPKAGDAAAYTMSAGRAWGEYLTVQTGLSDQQLLEQSKALFISELGSMMSAGNAPLALTGHLAECKPFEHQEQLVN